MSGAVYVLGLLPLPLYESSEERLEGERCHLLEGRQQLLELLTLPSQQRLAQWTDLTGERVKGRFLQARTKVSLAISLSLASEDMTNWANSFFNITSPGEKASGRAEDLPALAMILSLIFDYFKISYGGGMVSLN